MQCLVERRRGGETGVRAVTCLQGEEMWRAMDRGVFSRELLEAGMLVPAHANGDFRKLTVKADDAGVFIIEYRDGFKRGRHAQRLDLRRRRRVPCARPRARPGEAAGDPLLPAA